MTKNPIANMVKNSSRHYLDQFAARAARSVPDGAMILDAGAGEGQYMHHFTHTEYESADFCQLDKQYGTITYVCDLSVIPVEDNRYDLVFCSQTLEHMPDPLQVLKELHRVLKPGGELWLSAPLFFEEHEVPYDFYRYTQYGFRYLLETAGFLIKEIEWLEGYYGTLSYELRMAARVLPMHAEEYGGGITGLLAVLLVLFLKPTFYLVSIVFSRLDIRYKFFSKGHCKNYSVVAVK
jgi:ubiquinone/menaquinone biosynthesis C-methylase UbiE